MNARRVTVFGLMALVLNAVGIEVTWTGAVDNDFGNVANWTVAGGGAPAAGSLATWDTVNIPSGTPRVSGGLSLAGIKKLFLGATAELTLDCNGSTAYTPFDSTMVMTADLGAKMFVTNGTFKFMGRDNLSIALYLETLGATSRIYAGVAACGVYTVVTNGIAVQPEKFHKLSGNDSRIHVRAKSIWTGAAGDRLMSNPDNWLLGAVPKSSQYYVFFPEPVEGVITNDLGTASSPFGLYAIACTGTKSLTFEGNVLKPQTSGDLIVGENVPKLTLNCGMMLVPATQAGYTFKSNFELNGPITSEGGSTQHAYFNTLYGSNVAVDHEAHFNGPIDYRGTRLQLNPTPHCPLYFHDTLSVVRALATATSTGAGYCYFDKQLTYESFTNNYHYFVLNAANILCPTGVLAFAGSHNNGVLDLNGFDQTTDCLTGTYKNGNSTPSDTGRVIQSVEPATLTIKARASAEVPCIVKGDVSIVYAATDPSYVQTFAYRTNPTTGMLIVSNGTLRVANGASFPNVKAIRVCGTGKLVVDAANGVANPFAGLQLLELEAGGEVSLPSGVTLPLTLPDSATGGVSCRYDADTTAWQGASGDWNTSANWSAGVPNTALAAMIVGRIDEPATVTVSTDAAPAANLTVAPVGAAETKLAVNAKLPLEDAVITLTDGAKVEVGNGGRLSDVGTLFKGKNTDVAGKIDGGAELTVKDGGVVSITNKAGLFVVGGDSADSLGTLKVEEGGTFEFYMGQTNCYPLIAQGGTLDIQGVFRLARRYSKSNTSRYNFWANGGAVRLSGNGELQLVNDEDRGGRTYFQCSDFAMSGNSVISVLGGAAGDGSDWYSYFNFHPVKDGLTTYTFSDNSGFSNSLGHVTFSAGSAKRELHVDMSHTTRGFCPTAPNAIPSIAYDLSVGGSTGTTRFDYGGQGFALSLYSLKIGRHNGSSVSAGVGSTNEVHLMNGANVSDSAQAACNRSSASASSKMLDQMYGIGIGEWYNPSASTTKDQRAVKAKFTLSDANTKLSTSYGHFTLGVGRAEGRFIHENGTNLVVSSKTLSQTGNTVDGVANYRVYATNSVCLIGHWGGYGEYVISNGLFQTLLKTFVGGGCTTNMIFDGTYIHGGKTHLDFHDAEGVLRLHGGEFNVLNRMVVGGDGTGLIEIGPNAKANIDELVLSNNTASVVTGFAKAGEKGGNLHAKKLIIAPGAELRMDVRDYEGRGFDLISFDEKEGDFDSVEVYSSTNPKLAKRAAVSLTSSGYRVFIAKGTMLYFR